MFLFSGFCHRAPYVVESFLDYGKWEFTRLARSNPQGFGGETTRYNQIIIYTYFTLLQAQLLKCPAITYDTVVPTEPVLCCS